MLEATVLAVQMSKLSSVTMSPTAARAASNRPSSKRPSANDAHKQLMFSHVEVIPDNPSKSTVPNTGAVRHSSSKLKRSPTPVLTSLTELTNAHFHQLSTVWNESKLPSFESDKRAIAATRRGDDPFDF